MSITSPLYAGAIEHLAHSAELFIEGVEWQSKFVILHLASAVESLLKDRMIDAGLSIYMKKRPVTVSIWAALDELQESEVRIPERPVIEILVDDRNTLQHRFGSPNQRTLEFYVSEIVSFFRRFLREEYGVGLREALSPYLSEELLEELDLESEVEGDWTPAARFERDAAWEFLYTFGTLEAVLASLIRMEVRDRNPAVVPWADPEFSRLMNRLTESQYVSDVDAKALSRLLDARNQIAHAGGRSSSRLPVWSDYEILRRLLAGTRRARVELAKAAS